MNIWLSFLSLLGYITFVCGLECYTCDELDWNHQDCTHKRMSCDPFQDACTTYIRYGVPEDYSVRAYRRYYISKGCDTRSGCDKRKDATSTACSKNYYNDWACVECCVGDLCNFYVAHLGASGLQANLLFTAAIATAVSLLARWRNT